MKKTIKCGIVAAVAVAAGFAAYQSYGSYGVQDSSLLMQNVEALAQNNHPEPGGKDGGEPNGDGGNKTVTNHSWDTTYTGEKQGLLNRRGQIYYVYKDLCIDKKGGKALCTPPATCINMNRIAPND